MNPAGGRLFAVVGTNVPVLCGGGNAFTVIRPALSKANSDDHKQLSCLPVSRQIFH